MMRVAFLGAAMVSAAMAAPDWGRMIRKSHPRIFLNTEMWPAIRARALGAEAADYMALKGRVDALNAELKSSAKLKTRTLRLASDSYDSLDYGTEAAEAAFVYLVTRDESYATLAQRLLTESVEFYNRCYAEGRSVNWYAWPRINAWAAFDWLFDRIPDDERKRLGLAFLKATHDVQPTKDRRSFKWENWGGVESGFYGTPALPWYAGLATFGAGIDDTQAEQFLNKGYQDYLALLEFRANSAGDDGGSSTGALNYSLADYPWADFNFFHSYRSATGRNVAAAWAYPALFPGYIFWNWLPGNREFGYGDTYHTTNALRLSNVHLSQTMHFYAQARPEEAAFAQWMLERIPREQRLPFPLVRFLLTDAPAIEPLREPERRMPVARHFENMGQVYFRSGSGPDDTYAMFTAGGALRQHKHFDANNFVIFKNGYLAVDTGTRPQPGVHLSHYYSRTVAHNAILIFMPGEAMPRYWGERAPEEEDLPVPNDGGQRAATGSRVVAFESRPEYAYVAGDATATYHPDKCRLALRQFVFVPPDFFLIFDRVEAVNPDYAKTWLLHTVNEPEIKGSSFTAAHENGRLACRTLLPEGAKLSAVGGPGKQFWSGGRNWPLPKGYSVPDSSPLLGQWRVEVTPAGPSREDLFLHFIQVTGAGGGDSATPALVREQGRVGVRFQAAAREWTVLFGTRGPASGKIRAVATGKSALDRELSPNVTPQAGLWGN